MKRRQTGQKETGRTSLIESIETERSRGAGLGTQKVCYLLVKTSSIASLKALVSISGNLSLYILK